jgi:hypothetical protein
MQNKFSTGLNVFFSVMIILSVASCKKEKHDQGAPTLPQTEMEYFNLNNTEIKANAPGFSIDINHDGRKDLAFGTLLVGDPINQVDKLQFLISSNIEVNLPVNGSEEVPVMNIGDSIKLEDFNGYHWFQLSSVLLVQKIISSTAPVVWEGHWKNAVHKYLPYQIVESGKRYNGWVELSVDITSEKIVIHKAAISKEPNKIVKAGN